MPHRSELQKMLAGELYRAADPELSAMRRRARRLARTYNQTTEDEEDRRLAILKELFGRLGERAEVEPPFHCDYGSHIFAGARASSAARTSRSTLRTTPSIPRCALRGLSSRPR